MKNYLIAYYSKTGNNRFIAEKIAEALHGDIKEIQPSFNYIGLQYLFSLWKLSTRTNIVKAELSSYDEIIVCGPIWGGLLISPLRKVLMKCIELSKPVHFVTCCGSGDESKDDRYGYSQVLRSAKELSPTCVRSAEAFPVVLVLTPEEAQDSQVVMKTRLSEATYKGAFRERLEGFITAVQETLPLQKAFR